MNAEAKTDAHTKPSNAEAGLTKFDPATLKEIGSTAMVSSNGSAFLPSSMAEAMELGKLMCLSNFVPPHLRNKPGDCLAVVMQATRWGMDPFAVANKTYFVQERMAYEAQLVNAVLNARAPLDGRLQVEWDGEGQNLTCKVTGKFKGDPVPHTIWQEIGTIKTKNSPLWVSSPRQQLAYYTTRMWARLFCPEVLLGVYTEDEARDMGPVHAQADGSEVIPPRPIRGGTAEQARDNAEQARKQAAAMDAQFRQTMAGGGGAHDPETGEVENEQRGAENQNAPMAAKLVEAVKSTGSLANLKKIIMDRAEDIDLLRTDAPALHVTVTAAIDERKAQFAK